MRQRKRRTEHRIGFRFKRMQKVIIVFLVLVLVLCIAQQNVVYTKHDRILEPLEEEDFTASLGRQEPECLLIYEDSAQGQKGYEVMSAVLEQMKVPWDSCTAESAEAIRFDDYEKIVLAVNEMRLMESKLTELFDWVEGGGRLMLLFPPDMGGIFQSMYSILGIMNVGQKWEYVEKIHFTDGFMVGGSEKDYTIADPYESSLQVNLTPDCQVYAESTGDGSTALIWRRQEDSGTVVVCNLGFLEKAYRGIYCAAYTLLDDAEAWPVINGSTFYIDDFPSPVPAGNSERILADYHMDIADFYTRVWWQDVYNLGKKYGIRYTGLVIEEYSDQVEGPFERNNDTRRYEYFGNMLLDMGGEIGFHGYNHMPLCLENFDFQGMFDSYRHWPKYEDMRAGLQELNDFCTEIFPEEKFQVYVPPSNVLSEEGRQMLLDDFPQIRAIASVYLPGDVAYEQEFKVSDDGMIETPRVISGYIMDNYTQLLALAELNFHFVNSHFQHPDDVLDVERGGDLGWEEMFRRLSEYTEWLYTAAPQIRNLTGIEMAAAVQQYDYLDVKRTITDSSLELELGGFGTQAWLMVRINEGTPGNVTGGQLTQLTESLYLLQADESHVVIELLK